MDRKQIINALKGLAWGTEQTDAEYRQPWNDAVNDARRRGIPEEEIQRTQQTWISSGAELMAEQLKIVVESYSTVPTPSTDQYNAIIQPIATNPFATIIPPDEIS